MNFIHKIPSNFKAAYPASGKAFIGGAGFLFLLSGYSYFKASSAQRQVQFRKQQLSLPVYRLSEEEHINPPWNEENINQWLYRRVEVAGRPIHRNTVLIPRNENGTFGYEYVVPLLVKEQKDRSNPQGLILSKGFIPFSVRDIGTRYRIQNIFHQKFVGFVSKLPELQNESLFYGNSTNQEKLGYNCADIEDFVQSSGFINKKQAGVAVIQQLEELDVLDQRNYVRRALDATGTLNYPYAKTESGALQLPKMPWDYKNDSKNYLIGSFISLVVGASIF